jgi:hypothetical protein
MQTPFYMSRKPLLRDNIVFILSIRNVINLKQRK